MVGVALQPLTGFKILWYPRPTEAGADDHS